ncbi:hypothetical protein [Streptomyces sp. NRRL S-1521]|nr:hypothetical protein [Streptomyces sp. NRRL S-1521]
MKGVKGDPAAPGQTPPQGADPAPGTTPAQESHRNNHGIADEGGWQ